VYVFAYELGEYIFAGEAALHPNKKQWQTLIQQPGCAGNWCVMLLGQKEF
jgi:hypothetical protein